MLDVRLAGVFVVQFFVIVIAEVTVLSLVWHGRRRKSDTEAELHVAHGRFT